jgi:hypothetical protein
MHTFLQKIEVFTTTAIFPTRLAPVGRCPEGFSPSGLAARHISVGYIRRTDEEITVIRKQSKAGFSARRASSPGPLLSAGVDQVKDVFRNGGTSTLREKRGGIVP